MSQIPARDVLLDQLLAELPLHEAVRRDQPDPACWPILRSPCGEIKKSFHKRDNERVLAMA
jgi:hypothetical protein